LHKRGANLSCTNIFAQNNKVLSLKTDFRVGRKLGKGVQGEVRLCKRRDSSEALRAVKIADKKDLEFSKELINDEYNILREIDHPNVLKAFSIIESTNYVSLETEYFKDGTLKNYL